jgi:hypothetical protein
MLTKAGKLLIGLAFASVVAFGAGVAWFLRADELADPLERPLFSIWPEFKPTLEQENQPPIPLDKDIHIENGWYLYGGAAGGSMTIMRLCRKGVCRTIFTGRGIVIASQSPTEANVLDVRGQVFNERPSNFTLYWPRACQVDPSAVRLPFSWECQIEGLTLRLHLVKTDEGQ